MALTFLALGCTGRGEKSWATSGSSLPESSESAFCHDKFYVVETHEALKGTDTISGEGMQLFPMGANSFLLE